MKSALFAFILAFQILSFAKEGFSTDPFSLPEKVKPWIERTYLVFSETRKAPLGTAFLVHHKNGETLFISAKHVVEHCVLPKSCSLRWGSIWNLDDVGKDFISDVTVDIKELGLFMPTDKAWNNKTADLGYFKTKDHPTLPVVDIKQLGASFRFPTDRELEAKGKHYLLGYPVVAKRPSLAKDRNVQLRISEGETGRVVPVFFKSGTLTNPAMVSAHKFTIQSNADSLGGNSGGPVVDDDGRIIGVLMGGPNADEYTSWQMYSYIVPVDYVRRMIGHMLLNRMHPYIWKY